MEKTYQGELQMHLRLSPVRRPCHPTRSWWWPLLLLFVVPVNNN